MRLRRLLPLGHVPGSRRRIVPSERVSASRAGALASSLLALLVIATTATGARADGGAGSQAEKPWMMRSQDVPAVLGTPASYSFESGEGPGFISVCEPRGVAFVQVSTSAPIDWVSMRLDGPRKRVGSYMLDEYVFRYRTPADASRVFTAVVESSAACTESVTEPIVEGDPITITSTLTTGAVEPQGVWVQASRVFSQKIIEGGRSARRAQETGVDREVSYSVFTRADSAVIVTSYVTDRQAALSRRQAAAMQRLAIDNAERWAERP